MPACAVSLRVALAVFDGAVGLYLAWYAVRRQLKNRDALMAVALVLLGCCHPRLASPAGRAARHPAAGAGAAGLSGPGPRCGTPHRRQAAAR